MWKSPINFFGSGGQGQETPPNVQEIPTQSWYPPSVVGSSPITSSPSTPGSFSSGSMYPGDRAQSPALVQPSYTEAAMIISCLKDKSVDELRKLLSDPDAYEMFFQSLEQVKTQSQVRDDFQKETVQLARENLEKETRILELRNQCMIIRNTELAAAQEKLNELEQQKEETLRLYSTASILRRLQVAMDNTDEESEALRRQLLAGDIDMTAFVQKYKELRILFNKHTLIHAAAKTSL